MWSHNTRGRAGWKPPDFYLKGHLANLDPLDVKLFRARLFDLFSGLAHENNIPAFHIEAGWPAQSPPSQPAKEAKSHFSPVSPDYTFEQLVLPWRTKEQLLNYISLIEVAPTVFGAWNLKSIEPNPSTAVNFRGPPGTGKTLAAHAIAHRLGKRILLARLSDLESKYHGDGPKNLVQLFESARAESAVLFIDEAESLLSRRFAQPEQAAESAINSMRTELLMALDSYDGIVIFASNLPHSYDQAVESRLFHVDFEAPDYLARVEIWRKHLPSELPLSPDVSVDRLAEIDGLTGRDIKMAVINAAVTAARKKHLRVCHEDLAMAAKAQVKERNHELIEKARLREDISTAVVNSLQRRNGQLEEVRHPRN